MFWTCGGGLRKPCCAHVPLSNSRRPNSTSNQNQFQTSVGPGFEAMCRSDVCHLHVPMMPSITPRAGSESESEPACRLHASKRTLHTPCTRSIPKHAKAICQAHAGHCGLSVKNWARWPAPVARVVNFKFSGVVQGGSAVCPRGVPCDSPDGGPVFFLKLEKGTNRHRASDPNN